MGTTDFSRRHLSAPAAILMMAVTLLLAIAGGCSKESGADTRDLLATVPADAGVVVVTDATRLLEKSGCRISDGKVEVSPDLSSAISRISDTEARANIDMLLSGESGIAPGAIVLFTETSDFYVTFMVDDPDKFKAYAEKQTGSGFTEDAGVSVCGTFAIKASQGWTRVDSRRPLDSREILRFSKLSENQSFLSNDCANTLTEMKHDIQGWSDINAMINMGGASFRQRAQSQLILSSLFTDAAFTTFSVDFGKDKVSVVSNVLNTKGEKARCNFDTSRINTATLEKLQGNAELLFAINISSGLRKQIGEMLASFSGGVGGMYSSMIKPLDGTLAFAIEGTSADPAFRAVIGIDGKASVTDLSSMLSQFGTVRRDGKFLFIDQKGGTPAAGSDMTQFAGNLKGAWMGLSMSGDFLAKSSSGGKSPFRTMTIGVYPESRSLETRIEIETADGSGSLPTLIKTLSARK